MKFETLVSQVYTVAVNEANLKSHELIVPEHFLYACLMFDAGRRLILAGGGDVERLRQNMHAFLEGHGPVSEKSPSESLPFTHMLRMAGQYARRQGRDEVSLKDVIIALFNIRDSFAADALENSGFDEFKLFDIDDGAFNEMLKDTSDDTPPRRPIPFERTYPQPQQDTGRQDESQLEKYAINLNQQAADGKLEPLIGREAEINEIMLILARRIKNNPLLVGDAGVGKTAIIEGIAQKVIAGEAAGALTNATIYHIDMGTMIAGTKYRGEFEARLTAVLEEAAAKPNVIIYVDEAHNLVGAGTSSSGSIDAASLIKPFLMRRRLRFIGCTSFENFSKHMEKDRGLARFFQRVDINEPTLDEALEILTGVAIHYSDYHGVVYPPEVLRSACVLSQKYLLGRKLPDGAIDIIDQTGAYLDHKRSLNSDDLDDVVCAIADIEQTVAQMAKIPASRVSEDESRLLSELETEMGRVVFGQDEAVAAVCSAVMAARCGINEPARPMASLLFVGPTGVGKTEIAKTLANVLNIELVRFDMSEYQESHSIAKLIGSPPGYVGHEQGGLLTAAIRKTPHCVLLLDEIEKAHGAIMNVLLQVMDYGTLTDNTGFKADFRNVILIMTGNAGARELSRRAIGFDAGFDATGMGREIERVFAPEFRNRLDDIIKFNAMDENMARLITKKAIDHLRERLDGKNIALTASDEAIQWIAQKGLQTEYGAREIMRIVQKDVKKQIAHIILFENKAALKLAIDAGEICVVQEGEYELC